MNDVNNLFLVLFILLFISCNENKVKLPVKTSLGNLVKIEQKDMVETSEKKIIPKPEDNLYLLIFEGKNEIPFNVIVQTMDIQKAIPYILKSVNDLTPLIINRETRTQYSPVFVGSPDSVGIISQNGWGINGDVKNYIWKGTLTLHKPKILLVYLIPKTALKLNLKDGEQEYQLK
ncbi:MAG: hypothetical protein A2V93_01855 [Ignavibacteria bacterium RBG_16_34_14]|nr:MAG: hypothetical protein A2V93_01855 [Ignavibacteria bacterium RBG_16_34_14]